VLPTVIVLARKTRDLKRSVAKPSIPYLNMYGVPANLDLSHFHGATCIQVAIGEFQIQFHFDPEGSISVDGRWELQNSDGQIADKAMETKDRTTYRIHHILGKLVRETFVNAPRSFGLGFENDYVLEIFDDSEQYESCQIAPTGVVI